jgi:hypothetical protein
MPGSDLEFLVGEARGVGFGGGGVLTEINHPGGMFNAAILHF